MPLATGKILTGVLLLGAGIAVTVVSMAFAASFGGVYLVTTGLMGAGAIRIARGVTELRQAREEARIAALPGDALEQWLSRKAVWTRRTKPLVYVAFALVLVGCFMSVNPALEPMRRACNDVTDAPTLLDRRAAMARVGKTLRWVRWLPLDSVTQCTLAEADLARVDRGICPGRPIQGLSCLCGDVRLPDDRPGENVSCGVGQFVIPNRR